MKPLINTILRYIFPDLNRPVTLLPRCIYFSPNLLPFTLSYVQSLSKNADTKKVYHKTAILYMSCLWCSWHLECLNHTLDIGQPKGWNVHYVLYTIHPTQPYKCVNPILWTLHYALYSVHCTIQCVNHIVMYIKLHTVKWTSNYTISNHTMLDCFLCTVQWTQSTLYLISNHLSFLSKLEQLTNNPKYCINLFNHLSCENLYIFEVTNKVFTQTRRYGPLRGPTSRASRALAFSRGFFCPSGIKRDCYSALAHFPQMLVSSSNLSYF